MTIETSSKSPRKRRRSPALLIALVLAMVAVAFGAAACADEDVSTTSAAIGFVYGDGSSGRDSKLHKIIWPDQKVSVGVNEYVVYVPGNARNYIINDGKVTGPDGNKLGDRHTPIVVRTSNNTPVKVQLSAYWTLNQSEPSLRKFAELCFKYSCATSAQDAQSSNFAPSPGWNGLLLENFNTALEAVARQQVATVGDDIWRTQDQVAYKKLGEAMSAAFADAVRARTGYTEDLFCGSGSSSGWSDPAKPGTGTFTCGSVRIVIDKVDAQNEDQAEVASQEQADKDRRARAERLYGPDKAGIFLGIQDIIRECQASKTDSGRSAICGTINIGDVLNPR